jgi:hypothetical protein
MLTFKASVAIYINGALLLLCEDGVRERVSELERPTMARKRNNQNFMPAIVKTSKLACRVNEKTWCRDLLIMTRYI